MRAYIIIYIFNKQYRVQNVSKRPVPYKRLVREGVSYHYAKASETIRSSVSIW